MAIVNKTSSHGNITYVLDITFVMKSQWKNRFFMFFGLLYYSLKNIETNYIPILPLKKIEITKVAANFIIQYQLN